MLIYLNIIISDPNDSDDELTARFQQMPSKALRKNTYHVWTRAEKSEFKKKFEYYLNKKQRPSSQVMRDVCENSEILKNIPFANISARFSNIYNGKLKNW